MVLLVTAAHCTTVRIHQTTSMIGDGETEGEPINLVIDGVWFTDQFAGPRLTEAGLILAGPLGGPARLTGSGRALLEAA